MDPISQFRSHGADPLSDPSPGAKETPKTHLQGLKPKPQTLSSLQEAELGWGGQAQLQQHQSHPKAHHDRSNGFAPKSWHAATAGEEPSPCY